MQLCIRWLKACNVKISAWLRELHEHLYLKQEFELNDSIISAIHNRDLMLQRLGRENYRLVSVLAAV